MLEQSRGGTAGQVFVKSRNSVSMSTESHPRPRSEPVRLDHFLRGPGPLRSENDPSVGTESSVDTSLTSNLDPE